MTKFLCNSMQFRLHVELFKLDMINLACGVIQISNKCSCLEIFDQHGNLKLTFLVVIPYRMVLELSLGPIPYYKCSKLYQKIFVMLETLISIKKLKIVWFIGFNPYTSMSQRIMKRLGHRNCNGFTIIRKDISSESSTHGSFNMIKEVNFSAPKVFRLPT